MSTRTRTTVRAHVLEWHAIVEGSPAQLIALGMPAHWLDGVVKPGSKWGQRTFGFGRGNDGCFVKVRYTPAKDKLYLAFEPFIAGAGRTVRLIPQWVKAIPGLVVDASVAEAEPPSVPVDHRLLEKAFTSMAFADCSRLFMRFMSYTLLGMHHVEMQEGPRRPDACA